MVINIGQDCWDMIMEFKFQMEHSERVREHKKKFNHCLHEMFFWRVNNFDMVEMRRRREINYKERRPIFLFIEAQFLKDICREIRGRDHPILALFSYNRHLGVRFIFDEELTEDREIHPIIRKNILRIEDRCIESVFFRSLGDRWDDYPSSFDI